MNYPYMEHMGNDSRLLSWQVCFCVCAVQEQRDMLQLERLQCEELEKKVKKTQVRKTGQALDYLDLIRWLIPTWFIPTWFNQIYQDWFIPTWYPKSQPIFNGWLVVSTGWMNQTFSPWKFNSKFALKNLPSQILTRNFTVSSNPILFSGATVC